MKKKQLLIGFIFSALLVLCFAHTALATPGVVDVTSPGNVSFPIACDATVQITLTEGSAGSLSPSNAMTLTLPKGFEWGSSTAASVYCQYQTSIGVNNSTLILNCSHQPLPNPETINVTALVRVAEQSLAQSGDVNCQVGGISNASTTTLKLGTYNAPVNIVNPAVHVTSSNCPIIMAGKLGQATGKITISEDSAGQLVNSGTINLTLPEGARWHTYPSITILNSNATFSSGNFYNLRSTYQTMVTSSSTGSGSTFIIDKGTIALSADFSGDLFVTVNGSAGAYGVVKLATVVAPVTAALENGSAPAQILCGLQDQALPNITIKENLPGAIYSGYSSKLIIEFPTGVTPSLPTVQVTAGDLVIDSSSIAKYGNGYSIVFLYSSTQPSTITVSNIKVTLDQNVPVGPLKLGISGLSVVETAMPPFNYFPAATVAARVTAGQVYLTAPPASNGAAVSGLVQLENGYDSGVNVSLVNSSTGSSTQVFTDASGNYQFINVQPGTYNLVATHKGFLKAASGSIAVSTTAVSAPTLTMKAGDLTGDNRIDLLDIATFAKNYGSVGN